MWSAAVLMAALVAPDALPAVAAPDKPAMAQPKIPNAGFVLQNDYARLTLGPDAKWQGILEKKGGADHRKANAVSFARVSIGGVFHAANQLSWKGDLLTINFSETDVQAVVRATAHRHYFQFDVVSLQNAAGAASMVDQLVFAEIELAGPTDPTNGIRRGPMVGSVLARNLQTNVPVYPSPGLHLQAICYPRFGFAGASVAIITCPPDKLRGVLQEVVTDAPELPKSAVGGPWAMDIPENHGSYLFNFADLDEAAAPAWIKVTSSLGMSEIDFHGGTSFRFGDFLPNPKTYPQGYKSMKGVTDQLHKAGIKAGLHTYAFFIDKRTPWVTPVPDPRLAKDATFTLTEPLTAEAKDVPVQETTEKMSTIMGFAVRNGVTIQIDDELITYTGVSKTAPYAFTGCQRGAWGTKVAPHAAGAKVHHLKECFGLFVPDPETTLFNEVAQATARAYNEGGFDMIYLDALDGDDILGGVENGWHYGSKFVYEIVRHLKKPALIEMSTFHPHLWVVRSRMGAWDHPNRGFKQFIDIHTKDNETWHKMFLPTNLGWWATTTQPGPQFDRMFSDDIDYLGAKSLAYDSGLSLMGINPANADEPLSKRLAPLIKKYEDARREKAFGQTTLDKLKVPGVDYKLEGEKGQRRLREMSYAKHKAQSNEPGSTQWNVNNRFGKQSARLRVEALASAAAYDAPESVVVADFSRAGELPTVASQTGVTATLTPDTFGGYDNGRGTTSGKLQAKSTRPDRKATWASMTKTFSPPLDLSKTQAMGVWVHGDGQGEVLNFQFHSPWNVSGGIADHYVVIDFTGWRYVELIEPEGERYADYEWPYGGIYSMYREAPNFSQIAEVSVWVNNLPPGKDVTCYLGALKAMPLVTNPVRNPAVTVGDSTITFPVEIPTGGYLELGAPGDCKLYGVNGELLSEVAPTGTIPTLQAGDNKIGFSCETTAGTSSRAYVTVIGAGALLPKARGDKG